MADDQLALFDERVADRTYPEAHEATADALKLERIALAKFYRDWLFDRKGEASSPEVQRCLLELHPKLYATVTDWRFLGCLFHGGGYEVVRYEKKGSHGRPVPVWKRTAK